MFRPIQPKHVIKRVIQPRAIQRTSLGNMMGFILSPQVKTCRRCGKWIQPNIMSMWP